LTQRSQGTAPLADRVAAYQRLQPEALSSTITVRASDGVATGSTRMDYILLADGTRVWNPIDLLPAVDEDSPTAKAARNADDRTKAASGWYATGAGGLLASVGVLGVGYFATRDLDASDAANQGLFAAVLGAAAVTLGVGAVGAVGGYFVYGDAERERETAFLTYRRSLVNHLGLTEDEVRSGTQPDAPAAVPEKAPMP
jgi:hypothetical protein